MNNTLLVYQNAHMVIGACAPLFALLRFFRCFRCLRGWFCGLQKKANRRLGVL